jgi:hypothetical protein
MVVCNERWVTGTRVHGIEIKSVKLLGIKIDRKLEELDRQK